MGSSGSAGLPCPPWRKTTQSRLTISAHFFAKLSTRPLCFSIQRPDGYLEFFDQTWLDFACMPLENLLGWGWAFLYSSRRCRSPYAEDARVLCPGKTPSGNIKSAKSQWCLAGFRNRLREVGLG